MPPVSRRRLLTVVGQAVQAQTINNAFLTDVMSAIEHKNMKESRKPSQTYKPSSFVCLRQMYFQRIGEVPDVIRSDYNATGMADTGTRRHEAIQTVLLAMDEMGYDWVYVDVADYLAEKWAQGKCLNIEVKGKNGAETRLFDKVLGISFMCDGILYRKSTGVYYLFEFKNQISFKYVGKQDVDEEHKIQVGCYCSELDIDDALVLYENRDTCELVCPVVFHVDDNMKKAAVEKVLECESYVERIIPPPPHCDTKPCRWCKYPTACKKAGK